ncbi:MAG: hypothetical protein EXS37_00070 [Opitutus sp.]|nr:hypothetical protein [Opitutus sp.]
MNTLAPAAAKRWGAAWPDALAFVFGLALAWFGHWQTTDLIWSLWLSSLVVGYAMIAWGAFSPAWLHYREGNTGGFVYGLFDGLAKLLFFTVHFGLFHAAQAGILNDFFPLVEKVVFPGFEVPGEALRRYGLFLPVAALAERGRFRLVRMPPEPPRTSVKAADIAVRKARQSFGWETMILPYKNVVRLHLLILFFAGAHFARLESFAAYALVYAGYFFPWRMLAGQPVRGA